MNTACCSPSRAEAVDFPAGRPRAGVVPVVRLRAGTRAFDPALAEYSAALRGDPGVLRARSRAFARDLAKRWVEQLRPPRPHRPRDRLRQGRVPGRDDRGRRRPRHRHRPRHAPRADRPARPPTASSGSSTSTASATPTSTPTPSCAGTRSSTSPPVAEFLATHPPGHRRPARHRRALRAARRRPGARGGRVLGRLLRALLVLQRRLAGPAVPAQRLRGPRRPARVRRPVPDGRGPAVGRCRRRCTPLEDDLGSSGAPASSGSPRSTGEPVGRLARAGRPGGRRRRPGR